MLSRRTDISSEARTAFIANTDFGRFSHFLHRAEPPDEVDFWQPSPHSFEAIRRRAGSTVLTRSRDYEVGRTMISRPPSHALNSFREPPETDRESP